MAEVVERFKGTILESKADSTTSSKTEECPLCKGTGFVRAVNTRPLAVDLQGNEISMHRSAVVECPHIAQARAAKKDLVVFGEEYRPQAVIADLDGKLQQHAIEFLNAWPERKGLMFMGDVGAGKTHAASAIVNQLLTGGLKSVTFATVIPMIDALREAQFDEIKMARMRREIEQCEVLVLDDLGSEKWTEWVEGLLYRIVSARCGRGLPILVTANVTPETLRDRVGLRIVDRLLGLCEGKAKRIEGPSRRWKR